MNTLGSNVETISRTDGQKPPHHKKNAVSYGAIVGQPAFIQKTFEKPSQKMTFDHSDAQKS